MLKYLFSAFLLVLTLLLGGCGKDSGAPKLIMVTNAAFPPYEEVVDGKIDGIDPAIVRVIAHRLGYELEIQDMAFNSLIPAIASGKADIAAAGITVTEDRKKQVLFTNTYANSTSSRYDAYCTDGKWDGEWDVKSQFKNGEWRSVAIIPFKTVGFVIEQSNRMSALVYRVRTRRSVSDRSHHFSWGGGKVHSADAFGDLIFALE